MALTELEVKNLEKFKAYARPVFIYIATACMALITVTICYLLITRFAQVPETMALLMAIFTGFATPVTALILGRSYEKRHLAANYPVEQILPFNQSSGDPTGLEEFIDKNMDEDSPEKFVKGKGSIPPPDSFR